MTVSSGPDAFVLRVGVSRVRYEAWLASDGRWYWHRRSAGRITDGGSYATRRSCRRAVLQRIRHDLQP